MNLHQNPIFHPLGDYQQVSLSPARTNLSIVTNTAKSLTLSITHNDTKAS
ncbi:MAG: hypothetical protein AAEF72_05875 [Gammaproteobacteria bacterium]